MSHIIASHNSKIIGKGEANAAKRKCSCPERDKPNCPLAGECLAENIIYQAQIEAKPPKRARLVDEVEKDPRVLKVQTYLGRTKPNWKSRRNNHTASFRHIEQKTDSGLSKYVWDLKGLKRGYKLSWSLMARSSSYSPSLDICRLCLLEKHLLMKHPALGTLNVEDEFYSACRHIEPLLLSKVK